ncbi:MAG: hypothetical protein ACREJC_01070 [Tepidisphaeraceae bacterium]
MIDRIAYRDTLHSLTDDELLGIALTIQAEVLRTVSWTAPVWGEWDDVTAECLRRNLLHELMRLAQAERIKREKIETAREFLEQAKRDEGGQP